MTHRMQKTDTKEEIDEAFKVFDREGKKLISATELKHVMDIMGEKLNEDEI